MTSGRPLLVAMNNPLSADPAHALFPYPEGCTGWRLWQMLAASSEEAGLGKVWPSAYLHRFERRNVLSRRQWNAAEAREAGAQLLAEIAGRRVIVLGVATLKALGLPRPPWWGRWRAEAVTYCLLPHPSGRCREYNDPEMVRLAGRVLREEFWSWHLQTISKIGA